MKDTDYLYAVGRIRANELSLLSSSDMRRLISAKSFKEAASMLSSKGYEIQGEDYAKAIEKRKNGVWQLMTEVFPDLSQMNSLIIKNDFHNLKAAVKASVTGEDASLFMITPSVYAPEKVYEAVTNKKYGELPEVLKKTAEKSYDILVRTRSAQLSDAVTDKAAMKAMLSFAHDKKCGSTIFAELAESTVACTDIKILYRCILAGKSKEFMKYAVSTCEAFTADEIIEKAQCGMDDFLSYLEKTDYSSAAEALRKNDTTAFEKYCDDRLMTIIEKGKTTAFGVEPVVAYWVAAEAELLSVRIILSAKLNNVSEDVINERVRELYV